uniref:Uncharacterized protein n=1 Tax=Lactuca sativa TaxID=4236 RepID=A0A9R1V4P0_LACSA|nr:hypothetical protein LSAT_V11C700348240 [Lactuca sativa]
MIIFMLIFLSTGLRLYIGNLPSHMDEVLVQTTKSRRIRMVERKTRKRSVDKPKTKHLEASVTLIRDHSKEYLSNLTVEFDQFGRAIGPNRFKFTSYRGVTTRKMISILIDSWDLVDQCDKDQLWLNIKQSQFPAMLFSSIIQVVSYHLPNNCYLHFLFKKAELLAYMIIFY